MPSHPQGIRIVKTAPPLRNIAGEHLPGGYITHKPPLLHFGWPFERKALLKWAAEHGVDTTARYQSDEEGPVIEEPNSLSAATQRGALATLAKEAGTPNLKLEFELGRHFKDHFLLTISSNYRFLTDQKSITQGEINLLDKYLKDHKIVQDSPAWHLDIEHYEWCRIY